MRKKRVDNPNTSISQRKSLLASSQRDINSKIKKTRQQLKTMVNLGIKDAVKE